MEKLMTTRNILHALYTCASKEDGRLALAGFFILPDRRVYSTDGRRLVVMTHSCFDKLEPGNYEFQGKPSYNKGFGEIIIQKADNTGPDINQVLKDITKDKLFSWSFTSDRKDIPFNYSRFICHLYKEYQSCVNYSLLDFLPADEVFDVTTKDKTKPEGTIGFTMVTSGELTFQALVCPIRLNVK